MNWLTWFCLPIASFHDMYNMLKMKRIELFVHRNIITLDQSWFKFIAYYLLINFHTMKCILWMPRKPPNHAKNNIDYEIFSLFNCHCDILVGLRNGLVVIQSRIDYICEGRIAHILRFKLLYTCSLFWTYYITFSHKLLGSHLFLPLGFFSNL